MSCKYSYKGEEFTEEELINVLARDTKLIEQYMPQEERVEGSSQFDLEDIDVFNKKVKALKETMDVEVIFDQDVVSSRVLAKSDPRTKEAGKPVIVINPDQLFKTTAIHEFGHIFIDSLPKGIDNPRFVEALEELKGTQLEAHVKAMYPDLSEDMLKKEIVTTAIGNVGSEIWESAEKRSKFESFVAWFTDIIKRTFGLERSAVESLSLELLNNKVKDISVSKLEETDQELRPLNLLKKDKKDLSKDEKEFQNISERVDDVYSKMLARVNKLLAKQQENSRSSSSKKREKKNLKKMKSDNLQAQKLLEALIAGGLSPKEAKKSEVYKKLTSGRTRLSSIKNLQEEINAFDKADKKKGIMKYLEWTNSELNFTNTELDKRNARNEITADSVSKAIKWSMSFNTLNDIQNLVEEAKNEKYFTPEEIKVLSKKLSKMKGKKSEIDSKLLTYSREIYAQKMAENDNYVDERVKEQYKLDWKELKDNNGTDQSESEYIIEKLQENKDDIFEEKLTRARARAEKATRSMSKLSMGILTEKEMKSEDIMLASYLFDKADFSTQRFATEEATEMDSSNKEFRSSKAEGANSRDMKKKYKGMFVKSKSGQAYYTSEYSPDFLEEKNAMLQNSIDPDIFNDKYSDTAVTIGTSIDETQAKVTVGRYESEVLDLDGKKVNGIISFFGAKNIKIEGAESLKEGERPSHVTYEVIGHKGETKVMRISINEAIARSEYTKWQRINTKKVDGTYVPRDVWKSEEYKELQKDSVRFKLLEDLKEKIRENNERYDGRNSLISQDSNGGAEFIRMHGMMKTFASRVAEGQNIKTMGRAEISKLIETQKDEFDTAEFIGKEYTDFSDETTLRIPSPYRAKLSESDQSYDLHTMVLMDSIMSKNYQEKKAIESTVMILKEVVRNKQYPKTDIAGRQKTDAEHGLPIFNTGGTSSAEYEKLMSMTENRLYGITSKQAGGFVLNKGTEKEKVIETQKIVKTGLKYFGSVSLVFNWANSIVNTGTGTISNLIEAVGGDVYNLSDYKKAQSIYAADLKNIIQDMGSNVVSSKTNMLHGVFNTMGPEHLGADFEENTRAEAMFKMSTLRPFATMGEHMMQSKVMYSILTSIKVQNDKGQWLDKNGNVVKNKKSAANLNDMISFKEVNGKRVTELHPSVKNTSFTTTGSQEDIMLETRNLIRSKVDELHGQYTSDIQAHAQRHMLGKVGFFLRKWMIPGYLRRWRGVDNFRKPINSELAENDLHYSRDQKNNMEGYYVTSFRFISQLLGDAKRQEFNLIKNWKNLTPKERGSIRKTLTEIGILSLVMIANGIAQANMDDDEEVFWYYVLRRQQSELSFFLDPTEAFKIAQTPTAAVGNFKQIFKTINYLRPNMWGEKYKVGKYKGESKLKHAAKKLLPRFKNNEDFKQSLEFLNNFNM